MGMARTLLVDDEPLICQLLSKALQVYSQEIKTVSRASEAFNELASSFYHACFIDIANPDPVSLQSLTTIRNISPGTKVVAMTRYPLEGYLRAQVEKQAIMCLEKPFDISELKAAAKVVFDAKEKESYPFHRMSERQPAKKEIGYSVTLYDNGNPISLNLRGDVVDISDGGIGLKTSYPLQPDHLISFDSKLDHVAYKSGIIRWSSRAEGNYPYRVGVEFVRV
jgi:CheY-like chemotaxis protein